MDDGTRGSGSVGGVAQILNTDGHTMQRPPVVPTSQVGVSSTGGLHRGVRHDERVTLQSRVEAVYSAQRRAGHFFRTDLPGANKLGQLRQLELENLVRWNLRSLGRQ